MTYMLTNIIPKVHWIHYSQRAIHVEVIVICTCFSKDAKECLEKYWTEDISNNTERYTNELDATSKLNKVTNKFTVTTEDKKEQWKKNLAFICYSKHYTSF